MVKGYRVSTYSCDIFVRDVLFGAKTLTYEGRYVFSDKKSVMREKIEGSSHKWFSQLDMAREFLLNREIAKVYALEQRLKEARNTLERVRIKIKLVDDATYKEVV